MDEYFIAMMKVCLCKAKSAMFIGNLLEASRLF